MVQKTNLLVIWTILKVDKCDLQLCIGDPTNILQITELKYAMNEVNKLFC
jgi:hypothetical protein